METQEIMMTAARAVAVFAIMLVVVRVLGKWTPGNFSAFDLLVALMLGEVVDDVIYGDVTFLQGRPRLVLCDGRPCESGTWHELHDAPRGRAPEARTRRRPPRAPRRASSVARAIR